MSRSRPPIIVVLAFLQLIGAAAWVVIAVSMLAGVGPSADSPTLLALVLIGQAVLQVACGIGLWKLQPYGRRLQIFFAVLGLIAFPFGTIVSILVLYYLFTPPIRLLFSGQAARERTSEQSAEMATVSGRPPGATMLVALAMAALGAACADELPDQDLRILGMTPSAKLSADLLWSDYQADRAAADAKYWGEAIEVSGPVSTIAQDPPRIVFLQQEEPAAGVEARLLDDRAAETLAAATVGERLTLRCFCQGLAGNVVLKSCIRP